MLAIDLTDKKALVTGGSRGIGAACCRLLARAGADVGIHYHRNETAARAVAAAVEEAGSESAVLQADIARPDQVEGLFAAFRDALGAPDLVVTNAGIWKEHPFSELSSEGLRETLAVNLEGTMLCCREAARAMEEGGGAIVTISSTAGQRGEARHAPYAASKGGVQALTKSLASELGPSIRVNSVAPGWVETDMTADPLRHMAERTRILSEIPLGRVASPEDIAGAVVFLASDLARHVTGEILNVNGGSVLCG